ncbi:unnamed protein product [Hermetia illucens]|uniref:Uncharacterized protein n=1 Tax=Hermetia illucens TaxID=343691 RepID=A0A7R8YW01_HERIL|nr:unnamed protein product [Hermetia illucens]
MSSASHCRRRRQRSRQLKGVAKTYSIGVQATPQEIDAELERLCGDYSALKSYREYKMKRKAEKYPNLIVSAKCGDKDDGPINPHYGQNFVESPKHPNFNCEQEDVV